MAAPAIAAHDLSKRYRIGLREERADTLVGAALRLVSAPARNLRRLRRLRRFGDADDAPDLLWALRDASFTVGRGEVLGVIGANGAGKSTLLKILAGITDPSAGRAEVRGRVSSLLEVGTGFHPELTGRENVYLNATVLGMTRREVESKFDRIVDFSGLERFLDTPIKRYSSGMRVRLAFSVAAHLEPEILLVDEVLAVGDREFQRRCLGKMDEVVHGGRTVLFVSHQMGAVQALCPRSLLLDGGRIVFDGPSEEAIRRYGELQAAPTGRRARFEDDGDGPVAILAAAVATPGRGEDEPFDLDDPLVVSVTYRVRERLSGCNLAMLVRREGVPLFASFDVDRAPERLEERMPGTYRARIELPRGLLKAGRYAIDLDAGRPGYQVLTRRPGALSFEIVEDRHDLAAVSWARFRAGAIVAPLDWELERLE